MMIKYYIMTMKEKNISRKLEGNLILKKDNFPSSKMNKF